jgi:hypothetical protein
MVIGLLGMLFTLVVWDDWRPGRRSGHVDDDYVVRRSPVIVDEDPAPRRTVTRFYR